MLIKTSNLTDIALDWVVAKCQGYQAVYADGSLRPVFRKCKAVEETWPEYSTDVSECWPIIEQEGITISKTVHGLWEAYKRPTSTQESYQTDDIPLIAAMRCYVASKLGDTVEVPDELVIDQSKELTINKPVYTLNRKAVWPFR